jgi:hypothetical protein
LSGADLEAGGLTARASIRTGTSFEPAQSNSLLAGSPRTSVPSMALPTMANVLAIANWQSYLIMYDWYG